VAAVPAIGLTLPHVPVGFLHLALGVVAGAALGLGAGLVADDDEDRSTTVIRQAAPPMPAAPREGLGPVACYRGECFQRRREVVGPIEGNDCAGAGEAEAIWHRIDLADAVVFSCAFLDE
jgi:hypothetical protein